MIAVTIGTTSWRQTTGLSAGEVEFTGTLVYDTDGFTPLMVWDGGLGNMRAMTAGEISALPAQRLLDAHPRLVAELSSVTAQADTKLLRALVLLMLDEFNLHALKHNAILDAVDAATSLADLKTRIGLIADYPARAKAQLINAMTAKITAGDVDA